MTGNVSGKTFETVFLPWMAVLILAHVVTIYLAPAYMWGVHFYRFFPAWIGWVLALLSLALLVPGVGNWVYTRLEMAAQKISRPFAKLDENKRFALLGFLSLPFFWIFRTRLHLLGDGYFRIIDLPNGKLHLQEWLDAFIHLVVYRVMTGLIPSWTPELTYAIISILCGGVFVFLSLKLSALLGKTGWGKVLIFFSLVSLGSVQLFFGYVESYSILQVVFLAYIYFAALYLSGKAGIFPTLLLFVVSVGLHVTSLIFAPSFIYLLIKKNKTIGKEENPQNIEHTSNKRTSSKKRKARSKEIKSKNKSGLKVPTLIALILSSIIILFWVQKVATSLEKTGKGIFILPLMGTESYPFGMFSLAHISEFVNQLLLISPLGISLIVFFLFFRIRNRFHGTSEKSKDGLLGFLMLATFFALIYLFVVNFTLGSADWDLRSVPSPFFGLLGVLLFLRWGEKSFSDTKHQLLIGKRFETWALVFIWFGLFHTIPWILINAHHQKSVDRYLLIQANDPHPVDETNYNTFKTARILRFAQLNREVKKLYKIAIQRDPQNPLNYFNLASEYYREGKLDDAIFYLRSSLKAVPSYVRPIGLLSEIYQTKGEPDSALLYLEQGYPWLQNNLEFLHVLGSLSLERGKLDQAEQCALRMLQITTDDPNAYRLLGSIYMKKNDYEKAKDLWENLLKISPGDSVAVRSLKQMDQP